FRACGFWRLSSRQLAWHGTGKSREPADRNVCATITCPAREGFIIGTRAGGLKVFFQAVAFKHRLEFICQTFLRANRPVSAQASEAAAAEVACSVDQLAFAVG